MFVLYKLLTSGDVNTFKVRLALHYVLTYRAYGKKFFGAQKGFKFNWFCINTQAVLIVQGGNLGLIFGEAVLDIYQI
jgi:hypothetical protein